MTLALSNTSAILNSKNLRICLIFVFTLLIFTIIFTVSACAQEYPEGYIVRPHSEANLTPEESALVDRSGADGTVSFWELPLWIQVAYLSGSIGTILGSLIFFPMVVRKMPFNFKMLV